MCGLNIGDSKWLRTFPQVVAPIQDEWLPGLLWRCDEKNGWPKNTTASMVYYPHKGGGKPRGSYVSGEGFDLGKLAQYLEVAPQLILGTTFRAAQQRLAAPSYAKYPNFWNGFSFRKVCPACIDEARLIRTSTALHNIHYCPVHHLILQEQCSCGAYLAGHLGISPFTCYKCGLDWKELPRSPVEHQSLVTEEQYLSWFTFFSQRPPGLTSSEFSFG